MIRIYTLLTVCAFCFAAPTVQAADEVKSMKAWETLVGKWVSPNSDGALVELNVIKSEAGPIVIQAPEATVVIGWDVSSDMVKATGFTAAGFFVHSWTLTGDGPTFSGTDEDGGELSMKFTSKDRYELTMGGQTIVGERKAAK